MPAYNGNLLFSMLRSNAENCIVSVIGRKLMAITIKYGTAAVIISLSSVYMDKILSGSKRQAAIKIAITAKAIYKQEKKLLLIPSLSFEPWYCATSMEVTDATDASVNVTSEENFPTRPPPAMLIVPSVPTIS